MSMLDAQHAWSEAVTWTDETTRREVFFFESEGEQLFGSLYAAATPSRRTGLVLCSSWGIEAHRMGTLVGKLAHKAAKKGGAALTFHYPGFGDSTGRSTSTTLEQMSAAAVAATAEAARRQPGVTWILAGVRLGASVAALARRRAGAPALLLIQPALDPGLYFEELRAMSRRARLGANGANGFAFGYPVPERIEPAVAVAVRKELTEFADLTGVAVRYESPAPQEGSLGRLEQIVVPGSWRFGLKRYPELEDGSRDAIRQVMGGDRW